LSLQPRVRRFYKEYSPLILISGSQVRALVRPPSNIKRLTVF
jgi:hypothetical protein